MLLVSFVLKTFDKIYGPMLEYLQSMANNYNRYFYRVKRMDFTFVDLYSIQLLNTFVHSIINIIITRIRSIIIDFKKFESFRR